MYAYNMRTTDVVYVNFMVIRLARAERRAAVAATDFLVFSVYFVYIYILIGWYNNKYIYHACSSNVHYKMYNTPTKVYSHKYKHKLYCTSRCRALTSWKVKACYKSVLIKSHITILLCKTSYRNCTLFLKKIF